MFGNDNNNPFAGGMGGGMFDDSGDGPLGNPLAFGCSDLRVLRIIAEGVGELNRILLTDGPEAASTRLQELDPVVMMAAQTRFTMLWNQMVQALGTVMVFFTLFGHPQTKEADAFLNGLQVIYQRIKREVQPLIDARLAHGFDTPWVPGEHPVSTSTDSDASSSRLTDDEERAASFILGQLDLGSIFGTGKE